MIINTHSLLQAQPIKNMVDTKKYYERISYGLTEAGYDIRLKQDIVFFPNYHECGKTYLSVNDEEPVEGHFVIASAIEEFQMPNYLVGRVTDKSTWARMGLSVFNTVIEPGFCGGLTLELVYHGKQQLHLNAGIGIAQVLFEEIKNPSSYSGKYQNQSSEPTKAIFEEE